MSFVAPWDAATRAECANRLDGKVPSPLLSGLLQRRRSELNGASSKASSGCAFLDCTQNSRRQRVVFCPFYSNRK